MKPKVVIILGPTGVGKSEVAMSVALHVQGEIVSADSLQIYRHMDVGTGKPAPEQRREVRHHLIDMIDPDREFNAAMFREMALKAIQEIRSRRNQAIVCGGTGLYIKVLIHGLFVGPGRDAGIRKDLEEEAKERGLGCLYERLKQIDPDVTSWIHPNDRQRIIRALEVFTLTGKRMSEWQGDHGFGESSFESLKIGLNRDREELYGLIDRRCEEMVVGGLIEEVRWLAENGYGMDLKPLQSVGYNHIGLYLRGEMGLEESLALMKRDTRRLAKRQLTWFRADKEIRWFHPEHERKEILDTARDFLQ
ncbi:MAG: tRNA (adenosine(37)-N6)-dimethylallyltransferase MiaA [Deltaproteobacteria bacterium]|nr:tRNA (adenosine(37)-N6)-dimethylallyltransferase MiaA [Deltaproteobacteria bacterium]